MSDACKRARSIINNQDLIIRLGYHGTLKIIKFYALVLDRDSIISRLTRINAPSPIIKLRMLSPQTILTLFIASSSIYTQLEHFCQSFGASFADSSFNFCVFTIKPTWIWFRTSRVIGSASGFERRFTWLRWMFPHSGFQFLIAAEMNRSLCAIAKRLSRMMTTRVALGSADKTSASKLVGRVAWEKRSPRRGDKEEDEDDDTKERHWGE